MKNDYEQYMDALAIRVGASLHGASHWDAAHACALVSVHAIVQSTEIGAARQRRLEAMFEFMRHTMACAELAEKGSLQ